MYVLCAMRSQITLFHIYVVGELVMTYYEWMSTHKVTDACAKAVHSILVSVLPKQCNLPSWWKIKGLVDSVYDNNVVSVDVCPNDCIAYYDATHPSLAHYKHAHRKWCPVCGASRHVEGIAAKVAYYFPLDSFLASVFAGRNTSHRCVPAFSAHGIPHGTHKCMRTTHH